MRTLNEVIEAIEVCRDSYVAGKIIKSDALHYLKAFRDAKDTLEREKDRYAEAVKNCERAENKYKKLTEEASQNLVNTSQITCPKCHSEFVILPESNDPLTWDELQQMEGKPVWVEQHHGDTKGWLLILRKCDDVVTCTTKHGNSFYLYKANYGEKWQAYRKERQ